MNRPTLIEYIWLDSNEMVRSKKRVLYNLYNRNVSNYKSLLEFIPKWSYDGSSTGQASGTRSDIELEPVNIFLDPFHNFGNGYKSYLVLCNTIDMSGNEALGNFRKTTLDLYNKHKDQKPLFGIEQEYFLLDDQAIRTQKIIHSRGYRWVDFGYSEFNIKQGDYYCSIGHGKSLGRDIVDRHLLYCLDAGITICGYNAEVAPSQWEFQVGPLDPIECSDQLIIARYILERIAEEENACVSYYPKHFKSLNGSGGHVNYSTSNSRNAIDGIKYLERYCKLLEKTHSETMEYYGEHNKDRLSGIHETSNYDQFSWGYSDRGKSIRIPLGVVKEGYGYLEDRRPASNLNPYKVTWMIMKSTLDI